AGPAVGSTDRSAVRQREGAVAHAGLKQGGAFTATTARVSPALGAAGLLVCDAYVDTLALAHRIEREQGKTLIHPYADPLVIAGQGTIGLEILDDLPEVELVIVAVGGGGLIAGIALALRSSRPTIRIVGVEPEGAAAVGRSVRAGHPT